MFFGSYRIFEEFKAVVEAFVPRILWTAPRTRRFPRALAPRRLRVEGK